MLSKKIGFYKLLYQHIVHVVVYIKAGDSIMADTGFTIGSKLETLGLHLDLPLFFSSGTQMSQSFKTTEFLRKPDEQQRGINLPHHRPRTPQDLTGLLPP